MELQSANPHATQHINLVHHPTLKHVPHRPKEVVKQLNTASKVHMTDTTAESQEEHTKECLTARIARPSLRRFGLEREWSTQQKVIHVSGVAALVVVGFRLGLPVLKSVGEQRIPPASECRVNIL